MMEVSFVQLPKDGGIDPSSSLKDRSKYSSLAGAPTFDGIRPERELTLRSRWAR
jgi:hypothetical protein